MNRIRRMAERDKNFTSICIWSLGNEAGRGAGPKAMHEWLREEHPDRPVHCEYDKNNADMVSAMYAGPGWNAGTSKPSVLCEYTHAMGNSNGNVKEYWDHIYSNDRHMGAYVWDWADQGIRVPVPAEFQKNVGTGPVKETFYAYGGWWEDAKNFRHDDNFCMNGLVSADREIKPGLFTMKYAYRNIHVTAVDVTTGKFKVKNWFDFSNIKNLANGSWEALANGHVVASGKIPELDVAARQEAEFSIEMPALERMVGTEYLLTLSFTAKEGYSPLVEPGHEISWEQFTLIPAAAVSVPTGISKVKISDGPEITVSTPDQIVTFNKAEAMLTSFKYKGREMIRRGFVPDFWRALTDNDRRSVKKFSNPHWQHAVLEVVDTNVQQLDDSTARVVFNAKVTGTDGAAQLVYTIYGNNEVEIAMTYSPGQGKGPQRFGLELLLDKEFENVTYYGRGPNPTYQDRKFERVGIFKTTVDGMWVDYSEPQENGNHEETRWVAMTDNSGKGLLFIGNPQMNFGAKHYAQDVIQKAKYAFQMERSDAIHLNIDGGQNGVGGNNSWGATPLRPYILTNKEMSYSFRMMPIEDIKDADRKMTVRPKAYPVTVPMPEVKGGSNASSEETGNEAGNATDGDLGTRWCADGGSFPQWIKVKLDKPTSVKTVVIWWEEKMVYQYIISGSVDGKKWTVFADRTKNSVARAKTWDKIQPRDIRYIRVTVTAAPDKAWASIREIKVNVE